MRQQRSGSLTRWARWVATFVGFPAAGVVARLVTGDVDSTRAAVVGGLAGGVALGAIQAVVGGISPGRRVRWTLATAGGLAVGLGVGATVVDFRTDAASLVVMGALCGVAVGLAQALSGPLTLTDRLLWIGATPLLWAVGWWITAQVIVDADRHHATFGSSGALVVSAVSGVLVARWRHAQAGVRTAPVGSSFAGGAS